MLQNVLTFCCSEKFGWRQLLFLDVDSYLINIKFPNLIFVTQFSMIPTREFASIVFSWLVQLKISMVAWPSLLIRTRAGPPWTTWSLLADDGHGFTSDCNYITSTGYDIQSDHSVAGWLKCQLGRTLKFGGFPIGPVFLFPKEFVNSGIVSESLMLKDLSPLLLPFRLFPLEQANWLGCQKGCLRDLACIMLIALIETSFRSSISTRFLSSMSARLAILLLVPFVFLTNCKLMAS